MIFNKVKWRLYVGSCATFKKRWYQHSQSLKSGKHANKFLQADFNQCGETAFEFHVLEAMPGSTKQERTAREQHWLDIHFDNGNQCYNLRKDSADSRAACKDKKARKKRGPFSEEHRKKISAGLLAAVTDESREAARQRALSLGLKPPVQLGNKHRVGKTLSQDHRAAISAAHIGKKHALGYKHTNEAREKIATASRRPCSEATKEKIRQKKLARDRQEG